MKLQRNQITEALLEIKNYIIINYLNLNSVWTAKLQDLAWTGLKELEDSEGS